MQIKKLLFLILTFVIIISYSCCYAQTYTYETKLKPKIYAKDFIRGKAQITFRKNYKKLLKNPTPENIKRLENIHKYRQLEMENAFKHAFVTAKITYVWGEKIAIKSSYIKELKSYDTEIKNFGGKVPAFLDTNCDLWNGEMGISYARKGKKERKKFKKVGDEIFDNITLPNSDFIIDYKNDSRRWDKNTNPDNIMEILDKKYKMLNKK